jgi:hypothetical protein
MAQAKATRRGRRRVNRGAVVTNTAAVVTPAVRRIIIIRDGQFVPAAGRDAPLRVAARGPAVPATV